MLTRMIQCLILCKCFHLLPLVVQKQNYIHFTLSLGLQTQAKGEMAIKVSVKVKKSVKFLNNLSAIGSGCKGPSFVGSVSNTGRYSSPFAVSIFPLFESGTCTHILLG